MTFLEKLLLIERLHSLIQRKATGTPKALARKLNISRRQLFRHLETLRSLGAEIEYCHDSQSYRYNKPPKCLLKNNNYN